MTTQVTGTKFRAGKVVIGPRAIGEGFYRIVSLQDRSGRIETYDPQSRSWSAAPETVTFNDVWKATPVSQLEMDRACTAWDDLDDDELIEEVEETAGTAQLAGVH
jgi:hypothetical protein